MEWVRLSRTPGLPLLSWVCGSKHSTHAWPSQQCTGHPQVKPSLRSLVSPASLVLPACSRAEASFALSKAERRGKGNRQLRAEGAGWTQPQWIGLPCSKAHSAAASSLKQGWSRAGPQGWLSGDLGTRPSASGRKARQPSNATQLRFYFCLWCAIQRPGQTGAAPGYIFVTPWPPKTCQPQTAAALRPGTNDPSEQILFPPTQPLVTSPKSFSLSPKGLPARFPFGFLGTSHWGGQEQNAPPCAWQSAELPGGKVSRALGRRCWAKIPC